MIGLIPAALAFIFGGVNLALDRFRPLLAYRWGINLAASGLVLLVSGLVGLLAPAPVDLPLWRFDAIGDLKLVFQFDYPSWAFSLGVGFILLLGATACNRDARQLADDISARAFLLSGAVLLLAAAGNLAALAAGLFALDLLQSAGEYYASQRTQNDNDLTRSLIIRLASNCLLVFSLFLPKQPPTQIDNFPLVSWQWGMILLAAALRIGIFFPDRKEQSMSQARSVAAPFKLLFSMVGGIAGLILLIRLPSAEVPTLLIFIGLLFALLTSVSVFIDLMAEGDDHLYAAPFIFYLSAVAFTAALFSLPDAAKAWGIAAVFSGGIIAFVQPDRNLKRFVGPVVLLLCLGLPFTTTWAGVQLFAEPGSLARIVLVIPHSLITAAMVYRIWRTQEQDRGGFDFQVLLVRVFLLLMLLVFILLGVWQALNLDWSENLWAGVLILVVSLGIYIVLRSRQFGVLEQRVAWLSGLQPISWLRPVFEAIVRLWRGAFEMFSSVLEGDSGLLWSMLMLVIIISVLITLIQV